MESEWLVYICPVIYILVGLCIKIMKPSYPTNGKNSLASGVRFGEAMKSEEKWNYAQRTGTNMIIIGGIIDLVIIQIMLRLCLNNVITEKQFELSTSISGLLILLFIALILNYKTKKIGS